MTRRAPKLVLAVIDGLKPSMLERAVKTGRAPALQAVMERGTYVDSCCAAFPSVTPVCAATIATGTRQDRHRIPSMNWYHREEERYVEYGSSFSAARRFGVVQQLTDTVYNMNSEHLPADVPTVFETLDDRDVRTAGTTYLIYRGRHQHEVSRETALTRLASTVVRRPVMGPRELFYADLFASRAHGLPLAVRPAGHPRPARGLRRRPPRGARPLRLPAAVAARQRHALAHQRPSRAGHLDRDWPTASSSGSCTPAGAPRRSSTTTR